VLIYSPFSFHGFMKPFQMNFLTGAILLGLGLWGYFSVGDGGKPSPTALIPVVSGALFLLVTPLFKSGNKVVIHLIVLLTFLLIFGLGFAILGRYKAGDMTAVARVATMTITCVVATVVYVKSFIDARRNRAA
jgi:hypothetical protein